MRLENKRVLVTGGARGLGRAFAEAAIGAGARVTIADIEEELGRATAREIGADFVALDLASPLSIETANTSFAPVLTYATPACTTGWPSPEYCGAAPEPRKRVRQTPLSLATLLVSIWLSGE